MFSKTASNWNTFRYRDYRILWVILMTGGVASWLRILGFSQWLLDETGSPFLVGLIGIVQLVVQLPSTLWAGTLADRTDRKMILAAAHGITFIVLAFVATFNSTTSLLNRNLIPLIPAWAPPGVRGWDEAGWVSGMEKTVRDKQCKPDVSQVKKMSP